MRFFKSCIVGIFLLLATGNVYPAEGLSQNLKLNIKEFTLKNGMLFLIVERHTAPQVACRIAIRAGSALEEVGKTGIAHLLEHMMFKGTKNFGSLDVKKDQELQKRIEAAYQVVLEEERKREPNHELIKAKLAEMESLRLDVQKIFVPKAFSSQLGKNGAVGVNAFTSKDQTQYLASVPSDMLEQWFSLISEQLFEPSWREFYVEKEVVQREWAFRYINNPQGAVWLDLNATAYTAHPYRNPTIGWKADMEKYNTRDAMEFHARYYNPTNAICVLVGDVTLEKARKLANIYFARYPSGNRASERLTKEPPQQGPRKSVRFLHGTRTPLVRISFHAARMGTNDFYALDAMTMVLSYGRSARIAQNIVNKGHAIQAFAYNPDNRYAGMFVLGGSPTKSNEVNDENLTPEEKRHAYIKACEEVEEILLAEAEKLKKELVSTLELERIKKLNQREFLDRMRSNEALADTMATLEVQVGWRYLTTYLEKIAEVTPEDIRRVAKKFIRTENKTSVYVIPGGQTIDPPERYTEIRSITGFAAAKVTKTDTSFNNSTYLTPDGWKHPFSFKRTPKQIEYTKAETATINNTIVFYLPDRELPLIDLTLLAKAGAVDINDDKTGLSGLFSEALVKGGTEKYSPHELAMVLDNNAIRLSVSVREEDSVIKLSVMKNDWDLGLALLEEVLTRPTFDPDVFKVLKQQAVINLERQGGDAHTVSIREALVWHFMGHPYGRDPLQGIKTIPKITREDLKEFLTKYLVPSNIVVMVAGDIDKVDVLKGLKRFLGTLPNGGTPTRTLDDPAESPAVLAMVHKPGQVQSQVTVLLPGLKRTHPDYWKMSLLMDILGGNDSLILTRLRDDLGLVYSAWFYQTYRWQAGILVGYIGCKADSTGQAIQEALKIMTALQNNVPKKELEQKRMDALNSFVFNVDTPAELVGVYGRYYMRKEPLDTLSKIQHSFMTASKEELEILAREFLDPKKLQLFVVSDKTTRVKDNDGTEITLEDEMKTLAKTLGMPYKEIVLR